MALDHRSILAASQQLAAQNRPVQSFFGGFQAGQQLQQSPLQQRLLGQRVEAGQIELEHKRRLFNELDIPDELSAKELAFEAARLSQLEGADAKLEQLGNLSAKGLRNDDLGIIRRAYSESEEKGDQALDSILTAFERTGILSPVERTATTSASQREFESLIAGFSPKEQEQARRIKAGLAPRAVGTGTITTATTPGLTEAVAESEATIAAQKKFSELQGAARSKAIDTSFERIEKIDTNVRNIDRAITAIDDGASTGAIESRFFPTLRRATKELEQVQKELGLDVVGSVTFGALSEAELDLALQTALPTGLEPQALKEFLVNKREAQQKLRAYYSDQVDFLDQGGTIPGFLRSRERGGAAQTGENSLTDRQRRLQELRSRVNL